MDEYGCQTAGKRCPTQHVRDVISHIALPETWLLQVVAQSMREKAADVAALEPSMQHWIRQDEV